MGRGAASAGAMMLLLVLAVIPSGGLAGEDQLMVNGDRLMADQPSVVHALVYPSLEHAGQPMEVRVNVDGPGADRELVVEEEIEGLSGQLVTVPWTPTASGDHRLVVEAQLGDETRTIDERTVHVAPAPETSRGQESWLPATAPGTVQWAIAFSILFFVTRASFGRS